MNTTLLPARWANLTQRMGSRLLPALILSLILLPARATILISDAFSYDHGPLVLNSAGKWITDSGEAAEMYASGGALYLTESQSEDVSILLPGQPYSTGTLYAGFTVKFSALPSGGGDYLASFGGPAGGRFLGRVFATTEGAAAGLFRIGIFTAASTGQGPLNTVPLDLALGVEYRVVLAYSPASAANLVWVNPDSEASGGVDSADSTFPSPIASFAFRQRLANGNGMGTLTVDDLVVATTFDEVKSAPVKELWEYTTQNERVTITGYLGTSPVLVIPETIKGLPVTRVAFPPFTPYVAESITLPVGVTSFESSTFQTLFRLTNVTFLGPIKSIPGDAFNGCGHLLSVTYPDTLTSIGVQAFMNCFELRAIRIPPGVTTIGARAFLECAKLGDGSGPLTLPQSVRQIGDLTFLRCESLAALDVDPLNSAYSSRDGVLYNKSHSTLIVCPAGKPGAVVVPESVTNLQSNAFGYCAKLTNVTLPAGLKTLPDYAFFGCASLTSLALPAGLTRLGASVFSAAGLTNIALPPGITAIPDTTFAECPNLVSVTIPEQIRGIGAGAFANCANLTQVAISANVTIIGAGFASGPRLTVITVDPLNPAYSSAEGTLFNKDKTTLLQYPGGKTGAGRIPDGVTSVGAGAFESSAISSLVIPASVTSLRARAFQSCDQLVALVIPDTVTSLGEGCFQSCSQLASVRVGAGIEVIPGYAFSSCHNLSQVILSDPLRVISGGAFFDCPALLNITIPASVQVLQGAGIFDRTGSEFTLEIFFEGDAPPANSQTLVANLDPRLKVVVYHRADATGWNSTFAGKPAQLWVPRILTSGATFGARDGNFGFNITSPSGSKVLVEASEGVAHPVWVTVGTLTSINGSATFVDPEWRSRAARFYRLRLP